MLHALDVLHNGLHFTNFYCCFRDNQKNIDKAYIPLGQFGEFHELATALHVLFHLDRPEEPLSNKVTAMSAKAAVNITRVACQQKVYIAGRGTFNAELHAYNLGMVISLKENFSQ